MATATDKKEIKKVSKKETPALEATVYTQKGAAGKTFSLPTHVFGLPWNGDLVHQVVTSMESSARNAIAHTKFRGEVSGGGKKPWQQKGTGRARHGSNRSPIWVGGGVTHGPRSDKNFLRKVNKKMKAKALYTILSEKFKKGNILFIENFAFKAPKTAEAKGVLGSFAKIKGFGDILSKRKNSSYIALPSKNMATEKSFSNFGNVLVDEIRNINSVDLMKYKYVVIADPENSIAQISGKLSKKAVAKAVTK